MIVAVVWLALEAWGGGSGLNVVVVVNQKSTNSVELGNEYCEKRGVPPQNLFRMTGWTGGSLSWIRSEFEGNLRDPLLAMLAERGLSNQVDYVLLSMDIPYRVEDGGSQNSTTSTLFYGFKTNTIPPVGDPDTCSLPDYSSNSFAFSELPFNQAHANTAETNAFLAFMLTDNTLAGAQAILARGLAGDSTFPTQAVYLEKTSDIARNVRFFSFDNAIFDSRLYGGPPMVRIASDSTAFDGIRGLLTGFATLGLPTDAFVPGGLGDSLTSYAGALFDNFGQTTLLEFLHAGAVGSYGTVVEPCNYLQKFPDPLAFFYQSRGFSLAEAYYQSLLNPYQGLLVGEPLCSPFALPGHAEWSALASGTILSGHALLPTASFAAAATNLPIGQVDLFLDGNFVQTLTNLPPAGGNVLAVMLNGSNFQYTVPEGATLASAAAGFAGALNNQSNLTHIVAIAAGDRLELQSLDRSMPGTNLLLSTASSAGSSALLTTTLRAARPNFLDTEAIGYLGLTVTNLTAEGDWLQLQVIKTNGSQLTISVTNNTPDTNVANLCQLLMNAVNDSSDLQGSDGVTAADLFPDPHVAEFFLYPRSPGWAAAEIQATFAASPDLLVLNPGTHPLEDNISDLRPRNHLYLSSGLNEFPIAFTLDTTQVPDGFHEVTLVGYEGTSVRTQTRVSRNVQVQNTTLSASLTPEIVGTNVTLDAPLSISVSANTNAISRIELFSTGGSIGVVSNRQSVTFSVDTMALGVGLHPFYAVVTDALGNQFRTQSSQIRIMPPLQIFLSGLPFVLSWSAVPGFTYEVLASTNLTAGFQQVATVTASGTTAQWPVPSPGASQAFYKLRLSP